MLRLKYQNGSTPTILTFHELRLVELPEVERDAVVTLRRRRVDHLLGIWRVWALTVTTELAANDVMSIVDFWSAEQRWIQSPYSANTAINWVEVTTGGGRCPVTFVEDVVDWPEFTLELFAKEAS